MLHIAEENNHEWLLRRIRGFDLFSAEAKYHPKCRKQYTSNPAHSRSSDPDSVAQQVALEAAHESFFNHAAKYVHETIITGHKVVQLSSLRLLYIEKLDETPFPNPNYHTDRLRQKLENHPVLGAKLAFTKVKPDDSTWPFYLVYSSEITIGEAISEAYRLASKDSVKDVALLLRGIILRAFKETKELPWPPQPSFLEVKDDVLPPTLKMFINLVISGQPTSSSGRAERLMLSIGQDLCRAVSNGEWKLPKHILLCMTLRHLYRSKQLVTILNRLGHCESYMFSLELETAVAVALEQTSSLLTSKIVTGPDNEVFHSEWDNFNQFLTGLHGKPAFNTAAGIMLQESKSSAESERHADLPSMSRSKERTLKLDTPAPLPPLHISKRSGPQREMQNAEQPEGNVAAFKRGLKVYLIWVCVGRPAAPTSKKCQL